MLPKNNVKNLFALGLVLWLCVWSIHFRMDDWTSGNCHVGHFPYEQRTQRNIMFKFLTFSVWKTDVGKCHGRGVDVFRMKNQYPVGYLTFSVWKTNVFEFWKSSCFSIPYVYRTKWARIGRIPYVIRRIWHDFWTTCFHRACALFSRIF